MNPTYLENNEARPESVAGDAGVSGLDKREQHWNERLAQLESFIRRHGHWRVTVDAEGFEGLATWLCNQRLLARRNLLPREQREKLASLNVVFDLQQQSWDEHFAALAEFKARHGHYRVPRETRELMVLNEWLRDQANLWREGKLLADRRRRLRQLGWKPGPWQRSHRSGPRRTWNHERMFAVLAAFKQRFGHCRVPDCYRRNQRLADWLCYLRYLGRRESLAPHLRERLLQLGVVFGETVVQRWERRFAALEDYARESGDWRVPDDWAELRGLRDWLNLMRRKGCLGKLDPVRQQRLAALGVSFEMDPYLPPRAKRERHWEHQLELLEKFKARFGHCQILYLWPEDQKLATWFTVQLKRWRAGTLRPDRQERLARLGVQCENRRERPLAGFQPRPSWAEHYAALVDFHRQTGHCRVPVNYPPLPSLNAWLNKQRFRHRLGRLGLERLKKLQGRRVAGSANT